MSTFSWKRALALVTASLFLATGCTTMQSVPVKRASQGIERPDVNVGEKVVVTTNDGKKHEFKVTAVGNDALAGADERVAYTDIMAIDAQRATAGSGTRTAMIIGAVVVVGILAAAGGGGGGGY
jgi:hypothetical protein